VAYSAASAQPFLRSHCGGGMGRLEAGTWSMWRLRKRPSVARLADNLPFLWLLRLALLFGTLPILERRVQKMSRELLNLVQ